MKLKFYVIATLILCLDIASYAQQSSLNGKEVSKMTTLFSIRLTSIPG